MSDTTLCVVFDLDDTLYLERDFVWSGFCAAGDWALERHGIKDLANVAWRRFECGERTHIFDMALRELGFECVSSVISELVDVYRSHFPRIALAADVEPAFSQLQSLASMALITDGIPCGQRNKIEALGIANWFGRAIVTDEIGIEYRKPNRMAFELIEQHFRPGATDFVYIGDNPAKDFVAPSEMGWTTIRIRRPGGLHSGIASPVGAVNFEIGSLTELSTILFCSDAAVLNEAHAQQ